jgi:integrase
MLVLAVQTGLRISEITGLLCLDVVLAAGAHVHTVGKGRKERNMPLLPSTVKVLKVWLAERQVAPSQPLFSTVLAGPSVATLSNAGSVSTSPWPASTAARSRHTAALRLLLSGVDVTVIALWLGHEQVATTQINVPADMTLEERAIAQITQPTTRPGRYHAPDTVLAFLEGL